MSELASILELFGFLSIDEVTVESLKKSFKLRILQAHPDKGGKADCFDKMLNSYVYLTETIQRISGGRATLQNIVSPDELREMRPDEIVNKFFEEFQNDEFNRQFEEQNKREETRGYAGWLKEGNNSTLENGIYGNATLPPPEFDQKDLNGVFENSVKKGKVVSSIILHPEAMAYISATNAGTLIDDTKSGSYTSDIFANPEYTDVYSAFTENNTICDKVPGFESGYKSLEDIIAERAAATLPLNDGELTAIYEFEKKKLDEATKGTAAATAAIAEKDYVNCLGRPTHNILTEKCGGFVHRF